MAEPQLRIRSHRTRVGGASFRRPAAVLFVVVLGVAGVAVFNPRLPGTDSSPGAPRTARQAEAAAAPTPQATPAPRLASTPGTLLPLPAPKPAAPPPTLTSTGQALLTALRADLTAQWVQNHRETALRSGPNDQAAAFTTLPQWTRLRLLDTDPKGTWAYVYFQGDSTGRQPGPGWVPMTDVGGVGTPSAWLAASRLAPVWADAAPDTRRTLDLPAGTRMEVLNQDAIQGTRVRVRIPGDGRAVPPAQGWVDADSVARTTTPSLKQLPVSYPQALLADLRIPVPYRSQLDGSAFAQANCGPTVLGMVLESFGINEPPREVRSQVLKAQDEDEGNDDDGSFIWALARVAEWNGVKPHGLYAGDGDKLRHWTVDDVRAELKAGRPVVVQVYYRALPGRGDSQYYGDHYVVLTGLLGDNFLYNDPIGGPAADEAPGWDRVMTAAQLRRAMDASDSSYAFTAFSVGRS